MDARGCTALAEGGFGTWCWLYNRDYLPVPWRRCEGFRPPHASVTNRHVLPGTWDKTRFHPMTRTPPRCVFAVTITQGGEHLEGVLTNYNTAVKPAAERTRPPGWETSGDASGTVLIDNPLGDKASIENISCTP
jgi:hypothetical protein